MHVDYPWDVALSRVVPVPVILQRWRGLPRPYTSYMGTSRVRSLPAGTGNMALKPPFSSLYYCSEVPRPLTMASHCAASSTVFPTRGYRGVALSGPKHALKTMVHPFKVGDA